MHRPRSQLSCLDGRRIRLVLGQREEVFRQIPGLLQLRPHRMKHFQAAWLTHVVFCRKTSFQRYRKGVL
jgi:hypothetical protein